MSDGRMRIRGALVASLALLAACSSSDSKERHASDAQPTSTTTSAPSTTSSTTAPTTAPAAQPRIERVLADLLERRNQTFSTPDPARADDYLAPQCSCYTQERTSLTTLRDKGWHWATPMFEVVGVRVSKQERPDLVVLTAVIRRPPERVVDQAGNLTTPQGPGLEPTAYSFLLHRIDGTWKIADNFKLDLAPDLIRQISAEGIPS
jgi:hypothetical protein